MIYQNPPYKIANQISQAKIVNAGLDNSDGLSSSIYTICDRNDLGAVIYKDAVPMKDEARAVAKELNMDEFSLCLASGDWQFIYSVSKENIKPFMQIAQANNTNATIIGEFTKDPNVLLKSQNSYYVLQRIQNDRFNQNSLLEQVSRNVHYKGQKVYT